MTENTRHSSYLNVGVTSDANFVSTLFYCSLSGFGLASDDNVAQSTLQRHFVVAFSNVSFTSDGNVTATSFYGHFSQKLRQSRFSVASHNVGLTSDGNFAPKSFFGRSSKCWFNVGWQRCTNVVLWSHLPT